MATLQPALWPEKNVRSLINLVHHRRQDFSKANVSKACEELASQLPTNPRTGQPYPAAEIRKKVAYLKGKDFTWDDLCQQGDKCLSWKPSVGLDERTENSPVLLLQGSIEPRDSSIIVQTQNSNHHSRAECPSKSPLSIPTCNGLVSFDANRIELSLPDEAPSHDQFQPPPSKISPAHDRDRSAAQSHTILDTDVNSGMRKLLAKMNIATGSISEALDFGALACPQWDLIQVRYPETSLLLHDIFGVPTKGQLSVKFALLGLGRLRLSDWINALTGMAIHSWVLKSTFPTCLTRPDESQVCLQELLVENDAPSTKNLLRGVISDIRYKRLQRQQHQFPDEAAVLSARLASALEPMLLSHDSDEPYVGASNAGQSPNTWSDWYSKWQDMFLEALKFKARLALDTEFFEYRWAIPPMEFQSEQMESIDPRQDAEGRKVFMSLLPAIVAPDRNDLVLSKSVVVLQ